MVSRDDTFRRTDGIVNSFSRELKSDTSVLLSFDPSTHRVDGRVDKPLVRVALFEILGQ